MKLNKSAICFATLLMSLPAYASSIAFTYDFDSLRGANGVALTTSYVAVLIADSDGDSTLPTATELNGATLSLGQLVGGDEIFAISNTAGPFGFSNFAGSTTVDYTDRGINEAGGTIFGLYWFPQISSIGATVAGGASYGFFRNSAPDQAAIDEFGQPYSGMVFPAGGTPTLDIGYFDSDILTLPPTANTPTPSSFTASLTVIPETSSLVLSVLGLGGLLRRRRK